MERWLEDFKERKVKAKDVFYIREINKNTAYDYVMRYHYLGKAKFFATQCFGLYQKQDNELVGVAAYSLPQGISTLKSWFNLDNDTKNIYELSRLCLFPPLNGTNATSYLLGGSIRMLKKQGYVRAIITLASADRHVGSIYQVCNFKYYGVTNSAKDFYREDGKVNPRGETSKFKGVYLPRSRKHRYCYLLDDTLKINYEEQKKPSINDLIKKECCGGTNIVYDNRFDKYYTCPICTGKLIECDKYGNVLDESKLIDNEVKIEQLSLF